MYIHPQYQARPQVVYSPYVFQCINCIIEPSQDRGGLYLGDLLATMRTDTLVQYNIGAVLSVAIDAKYNKTSDPRTLHIVNKHILAHDIYGYDISQHFEECNQWIQQYLSQKINVLVHCRAGKSRSASVVIAYMMKKFNMTYEKAYSYVKARRQRAEPNESFKMLLKQYESKIFISPSIKPLRGSIVFDQEPLRSSLTPRDKTEEARQLKQEIPMSPASNDNIKKMVGFQNLEIRRSDPNLRLSFANLKGSRAENFLTPQKGSPTDRKTSFEQNSPVFSNAGSERNQKLFYDHQFSPEVKNIYQAEKYSRPGSQVVIPQINPEQMRPKIQQQQQPQNIPHYYSLPAQPYQNPIYQQPPQQLKPQYAPRNFYQQSLPHYYQPNYPLQQKQPIPSTQSIQQQFYNQANQMAQVNQAYQLSPQKIQTPKRSERQAGWFDWLNWFSHQ